MPNQATMPTEEEIMADIDAAHRRALEYAVPRFLESMKPENREKVALTFHPANPRAQISETPMNVPTLTDVQAERLIDKYMAGRQDEHSVYVGAVAAILDLPIAQVIRINDRRSRRST